MSDTYVGSGIHKELVGEGHGELCVTCACGEGKILALFLQKTESARYGMSGRLSSYNNLAVLFPVVSGNIGRGYALLHDDDWLS